MSTPPGISHFSGKRPSYDMVNHQLGIGSSGFAESERSMESMKHQSFVQTNSIHNSQQMGDIAFNKTDPPPPPQPRKSINEILKFDTEVFEHNGHQSVADKSHAEALRMLIRDMQPGMDRLCFSADNPREVHGIFKSFSIKATRIRMDQKHHNRSTPAFQINSVGHSEANRKRKSGVALEEERRLLKVYARNRRKSLEERAVDKLFEHRFLWYRFWENRTGIKVVEQNLRLQKRVILFLFYTDMIGTILRKYMDNDSMKTAKFTARFLLQNALDIVSEHYRVSFQDPAQRAVSELPKEGKSVAAPAPLQAPKNPKLHRQELVWSWMRRLIDQLNNDSLRAIFLHNHGWTISPESQVFFNHVFYHSIEKLNSRLSIYYQQLHDL
ncbi:uncharacterized protein PGTG_00325 [Puccinia graminis f. sp. tritici CRL 75-36-700-3]|uniref:Uncharacterized protein n=1 Tax=Puccinia graminis f. sp. tritici (strain CRL 75-36-700-3 / race SCCL) TaxID=418459 RepID=E3JQ79_PUCGT|nr:uncharacterized protein PGTG_00325 [Puccinia graminis f. sp. tritici CRL 75-36-700-3]EFP74369.2 hypothetical protein PGTG_00325 [Puccinia graminis f. sp. tritici CRL 75-36-700-3]